MTRGARGSKGLPGFIGKVGAPKEVGECVVVPNVELVMQRTAEADTDEVCQEHGEDDDLRKRMDNSIEVLLSA